MSEGPETREVIFEIRRIGQIQRVAAIDVESGVEVVIQAPASASRREVESLAAAKLKRALGLSDSQPAANLDPRRGKLV